MNKKISIALALAIIALAISGYNLSKRWVGDMQYEKETLKGIRRGEVSRYRCHTATTSPTYLTANAASSTCTFDISRIDSVDLNWVLTASTTSTVLKWEAYVTVDNYASTTNHSWFPIKDFADTSSIVNTHGADPLLNLLTPANSIASSTYHNIKAADMNLADLKAEWLKIEYGATGANGSVYLEAIRENEQ